MDWKGKVCILTGSTSGIGREAALALGSHQISLVLPVRDMEKGAVLKKEIAENTGNDNVDIYECDLSSMDSIRSFVNWFEEKYSHLHLLINNAGVWETKRRESEDGFELTFAVNHLAPFLLTNLLVKKMKGSTPARIVNVSSMAHIMGKIRFDDPEFKKRWDIFSPYAQSKLANLLFTRKLSSVLENKGIRVNALHPGVVLTGLYKKMPRVMMTLARPFFTSASKGVQTILYLALSPEVENVSGAYFVKSKKKKPSRQALNDAAADKLWELSCEYTGLSGKAFSYGKTG